MDQRTDLHRDVVCRYDGGSEEGSLSTYIAASLVLPLLAMIAGAGIGLETLSGMAANVNDARDAGVVAAEVQGGVTPQVVSTVRTTLSSLGLSAASARVSGTPGPVPWGGSLSLTVTDPVRLQGFPWSLMGLAGQTITLGGTTYATSNLSP